MNRVLSCLVFAGVILVPLWAAPQPMPKPLGPRLAFHALVYLNTDADLHKELQITDEQANKLAGHAALRARVARLRGNLTELAAAMSGIDKAIAEDLDPAQLRRLRQVVLQLLDSTATTRRELAHIAEVVEELKITGSQQKKLDKGAALLDVLTDGQKRDWEVMTGAKFKGLTGSQTADTVTVPSFLLYASYNPLAKELNVTEDQRKRIANLLSKWQETALRTDKADNVAHSTNEAVLKVLDPAQSKKLLQIVLDQATKSKGKNAALEQPEGIEVLKLTEDQQAKIKAVHGERTRELRSLIQTADDFAGIRMKVQTHLNDTYKMLYKLLNEDQQAMMDKAIAGGVAIADSAVPLGRMGSIGSSISRPPSGAPLHLLISGLSFVENKTLQEQLKLTKTQVQQLIEFEEKSNERTLTINGNPRRTEDEREKLRQGQAAENAKDLAAILEPEQLRRFKQLILQYYAAAPARADSLFRFAEVKDSLKPTKEQRRRVLTREKLEDVLDQRQQASLKELLGEPLPEKMRIRPRLLLGVLGGLGLFGTSPPANEPLEYLAEKSVQKDLRMTEPQLNRLPELEKKWDALVMDRPQWTRAESLEKLAAAQEAIEQAVAGILDKSQFARLQQIQLQHQEGLAAILKTPRAQEELELTDEQITEIKSGSLGVSTRIYLLRAISDESGRPLSESVAEVQEWLRKIDDKKLASVLTASQRDKLKTLLGEPFDGPTQTGLGYALPRRLIAAVDP